MTKGVTHSRREQFIQLMVDVVTSDDMIRVYKACFPNCKKDTSARSACYRMLQDVELVRAIDKLKQEKEEAYKKARQKELERQTRERIVTELQLDAKMSDIVMGHHIRKKKVVVFNPVTKLHQTVTIDVEPDETAIIAAADKLYKRKGSYAEKKIKHEVGDSFIEIMKQVTARKNKANVSS